MKKEISQSANVWLIILLMFLFMFFNYFFSFIAGPLACTSCPAHYMLDGGLCMECLGSQFYDPMTQTCKTCHESCRSCSGPGQYSCVACAFPLHLDRLNNQCVPCCPSGALPEDQSCCHCDKDTGMYKQHLICFQNKTNNNNKHTSAHTHTLIKLAWNVIILPLFTFCNESNEEKWKWKVRNCASFSSCATTIVCRVGHCHFAEIVPCSLRLGRVRCN